jgi:peroxiredoxin Q/BCP
MTIEVGTKAPEFTLQDQDGRDVSLEQFAGSWVVLYFYPKDDTPGCTVEACEFSEGIEGFRDLDTVILGCSPDSMASHRQFINKFDLKVHLLSDPEHGVMEAYGAWGEKVLYGRKSIGVKRSTVIIDPEGRISHLWKSVRTKGHAGKVRGVLEKLREKL